MPRRDDLDRITGSRGGVEKRLNRAWSAGAGTGALGAALALMPWCLTRIAKAAVPIRASVDPVRFREQGGLFLWEAFVSGTMNVAGTSHHDDARLACEAFVMRWPNLTSDICDEPAMNHAVSAAYVAGLAVRLEELRQPAVVVVVAKGRPRHGRCPKRFMVRTSRCLGALASSRDHGQGLQNALRFSALRLPDLILLQNAL